MEPEGSLSFSQEYATGPYSHPDASSPNLSTQFPYLPSTPTSFEWSLPFKLSHSLAAFLYLPRVLHNLPTASSLILSL